MRKQPALLTGLILVLLGAALAGYAAFVPRDGKLVEVSMQATRTQLEIAPGTTFSGWTFSGQIPGPVVRVREGDEVLFSLQNQDPVLPHSMDFHAAVTPWDKSYIDVAPGASHSFTWQARFPGVFMYHCGTAPALMHIANGMYGVIVVDPKKPRRPAREYVLVQSEFYGENADIKQLTSGNPQAVVFNGKKNRYITNPLQAKPGELIRLYVVNAGPNRFSAFHVVGTVFDRVYPDGNPHNVLYGVQTYTIPPGGGAIFEFTVDEEGTYPFVSHAFADATLGAQGLIKVSRDAAQLPLAP